MPVMVRVLEKSTVSEKVKGFLKKAADEMSEKFKDEFKIENVWYNENNEWCIADITNGKTTFHFEHNSDGEITLSQQG